MRLSWDQLDWGRDKGNQLGEANEADRGNQLGDRRRSLTDRGNQLKFREVMKLDRLWELGGSGRKSRGEELGIDRECYRRSEC